MTKGIMSIKRGMAVLLSACMIGGMMPLPASAEESVSGNTVQTESTEQVQENGEAGTGGLNKENKQPGTEEAPSEDEKSSETDNETGSETESETVTDAETEDTAISAVQALIDALPDADSITEESAEEITAQLDAIDEAKAELTDEELAQLDLTRYDAAINKVMVLIGMKEENDSEIAVQANDSAGRTEQQSTDEASVTINGETLYYATLEEAFSAADGKTATITMLNDAECTVTSGSPISVMNKSNITLNMNGKTLSGHGTGDCGIITLGKGSLSVQGPGTMKSTYMCLSCQAKNAKMTVENITFDVSEADYGVWVVSSNTVTLNNIQIIGKAKTAAVYQYSKSANVTINNMNAIDGGYSDVCFKGNTLKINGGTFDKISVNSYYVASITSVSQVLGEGCIYRNNEDKTWVTSELSNTLEISNVTVEKIPLTMNPEAETSWYYNSAEHSLQMNAEPTTAGNDITYEWYDGDTKLECDSDTYTVPKTMPIGSYTYTCKATCDGYTLSHEFIFTVEECKHENVEITFNSNGFGNCPKCNATVYQPAVETTDKYDINDDSTKDTVYEISNAGQLYWFADKVNNDNATYGSANAVLTEDIVVNENLLDSLDYDADGNVTNGESFIGWACIGWAGWVGQDSVSNQYNGTFDGQNHTVSGLYFNDAGKYNFGLFGVVHNDGSVSNVGVVDSCFYCYGDVGGVCGISYGTISNCYNTGRVSGNNANVGGVCGRNCNIITNCYNTGAVSSNSSRVGGVCGDNGQNGKISNCYNTGTVSGANAVGGVSGRNCNIITNCYNVGTVRATGNNPDVGGVCGYCLGSETIESYCYYLDTCAADGTTFNINRGKSKTTSQFASGEVTYALNQENGTAAGAEEPVWKQTLEGDSKDVAPSLNSNAGVVYQYTRLRCDGQTKTEDNVAYTNDSAKNGTSIKDEHKYEINTGDHAHYKCSVCGETEAHTYTYEKAENTTDTIKATCSVCGDTYTIKLLAPTSESGTLIYDGTAKAAKTSIIAGNLGETLTVTYATLTDGTESAYSKDAPKNAGSYRAKLALGSGDNAVSVTVDYTIAKATPTIAWSEDQKNQSVTYTGDKVDVSKITAPTVTLVNNETFSATDGISYSYRELKEGTASGEFTSGLPTELGTYEVKAHIPEANNYTAAESTNVLTLTIRYLDGQNISDATVTAGEKTYGADDWCPVNITLKAPNGYKISLKPNETYGVTADYTAFGDETTITYYLKDMTSNEVVEKSVKVKFDKTAPDWAEDKGNLGIQIKSTWWNKLLSSITFGLYKGSSLEVYANANDSESGVAEYYYYIDKSGSTTTLTAEELAKKDFTKVAANKNGTTKLTEITSDNNYVIYAYAIDAVGNRSGYICSDGIVLDHTAPKLTNVSAPAKSNGTLSDTSATITFTGSEAGTYYYILKEDEKTAPTKMSDFATKTAGDKVDTWTAESGVSTGTLTADEGNTITLTKLKANTSYILYLAATDAAGNASVAESKGADGDSGVVSVSFTTAKTIPYVKTAPVLSGNYGDTVSAMLEKADKTKASVTAGLSSDVTIKGTWSVASADADKIPTVGTSEKYTLTFTPTGSDAGSYDSVSCEVTPEVSKKPVTIVIDDKLKTYGEANPELTWNLATGDVLVTGDTEAALRIRLSTTVQDNSNAGTYAITGSSDSANYAVTFTGSGSDGKSGVLTVKQAANEFTTELSCSGHTYAKNETPKPNATAKFGTVTYKYAKASSDGNAPADESAYTDTVPVNAGIYAVKAYVAKTDNYAGLASSPVVFTINKAASSTIAGEEKSYAYSAGSDDKAISVDIAGKLPTDRGTTAYALTNTYNEQLLSDVTVDQDGNLTYKVKEADKSYVGATATIKVTASMLNYEDAVYTMTIRITDKKLVTLKSGNTVSVNGSNALTYGDKLSKLNFSSAIFVEADTDTKVKGTLEWADPDCIPTAGTTQAGWVFKPDDSKHYEELTGTAAITVARATPAVVTVPTVAEREYNPAVVLADSDMTGGSVTGADGNSLAGTWSFIGTIIIPTVNNKGYQAVFTPDDTNNYNTATRTITVKVTKATPVIAEKPTAGAFTYGQKLSDSTLTGGKAAYQTADGTEITGAFAWKNSSIKPTAADSQKTEYDVTFTPSDKDNYNAVDTKLTLTVNKAALAALSGESRSYIYAEGSNDKAETTDVAGKLPADRGNTTFTLATEDADGLLSDVTVDTAGKLSYKVKQLTADKAGKSAAIKVTASMENYEDAVYTMTIKITDKKLVALKSGNTVSVNGSNALTYGEKLSKLSLSSATFVDADTNTGVEGTLEWADPDCIPTAGTTQAGWVFKPADSKHYEDLTGTAAITVAKATPAVVTVPAVAERVYNPAVALADSDMTGGSVTGADGNSLAGTWSFTGKNIIPTVNNKGYQAVFTPDDTNNYSTVTRTITVKVTKATPVIAQKPTAGALTYGQELSDSTLTGGKAVYQTADGTEITGAFAWKNGSIKPTATDSQKTEYDVTFTPSDKDNYNAVDTKLTLTVNKAAQAPNMPQAAMAPAHSTKKVGDITLPVGWTWQEADKDTALADGVAVTANALYTGTDKGNYETESVSITITRSECEHKNTEIINKKDATCSVEGYTGDTYCKDCGETLATGTAIEKKPHTVGTSATCVSKAVCSVCGEAFGEVDANNHVHTTVKNRKEATCTQTGYTGDTYCTDCNKLLGMGKELAALGHDYKATVTKQPTTTEEGIRTYTCTRCNSSYTESIAKLPEEKHTHNYTGSITKEATCTEAGVRTYTCSCGDSYTENIPATGHSYVSKVTKAATTTEEGIMTYTCSKCGHSYTQPIAKIKSDDSSKDNGSQNQKPQTGTDNGNQNQKPQPDTDNGKEKGDSIKPYIKDDSGKEGWDVIKPQLEKAKSGDTVTVAMNGTTVVPKDVIDSIKGKDTTLVLDMGNGLSWKIYGKDITDAAGDIDFDVTVGADAGKSIPVDVINNVTGERYSMNLSLAYDGELGFTAILTVNMEPKNSGMYANLFYYNEQTGKLEFVSAGQIDSDGNVELAFTHASDYTIVVDAKNMSDNGQADNKADETIPASKTDDSTSKYAWNNTIIIIIGICIILIVFGAVFYVRKKSGSEEE